MSGLEDRKIDTGQMRVSCLELTMLDLLRYPHAGGGLDNIATVIPSGRGADPDKAGWARELISYGAQVLTRESMPDVLEDIPSFTASGAEPAF